MPVPDHIVCRFARHSDGAMRRLLDPPKGKVRLLLDTDTANEIDDQFALAWTLLSGDKIELEAVTAEPFSFQHLRRDMLEAAQIRCRGGASTLDEQRLEAEYGPWLDGHAARGDASEAITFVSPEEGAEQSYREILTVYDKLGMSPGGQVFRGSPGYLRGFDAPLRTPAAERIIELALKPSDRPLYIAAIGCLTNIASAMLIDPSITRNIVVLWTSSYPSHAPYSNQPSLNLVQDMAASQLLFASGAAHVYLPGYHVGAQLRLSLPEMERFVQGHGAIGDYLHHLYTNNPLHTQRGMLDTGRRTWVIWDMINIAWLLNPGWVPTVLTRSPLLGDDFHWHRADGAHLMREAYDVNRDAIFIDFYDKLAAHAANNA